MQHKDRTVPVILPSQDSDDLQVAYRMVADLVEDYNRHYGCQIVCVQFDLVGGEFGGMQRDYRGCYVTRDRVEVV